MIWSMPEVFPQKDRQISMELLLGNFTDYLSSHIDLKSNVYPIHNENWLLWIKFTVMVKMHDPS